MTNSTDLTKINQLLAVSPIDGRYANKTATLAPYFSEFALIKYRLRIEINWLIWLAKTAEIKEIEEFSKTQCDKLHSVWQQFSPEDGLEVKKIEQTTKHDVKAVEYFLQSKIKQLKLDKYISFIHFAATSEDINNLSYALMIKESLQDCMLPQLYSITADLLKLTEDFASTPMMARTHGQPASPTTLGKEFLNVVVRLQAKIIELQQITIFGKMNGAVGNYNAHICAYPNINWHQLSKEFINSLGLEQNISTIQIEPHDYIVKLAHTIHSANSILLDFATDTWRYIAINYFKQKTKAGEVGSSTMPHKVNPIDFENAEGNLAMANSFLHFFASRLPISRWQRDLTDSTILRNIGVSFAYCLIAYQSLAIGMGKLKANHELIQQDLDNNWELLAEPIQTIMRRYGINDAYEQLKDLSRGKKVDKNSIQQFVKNLTIPEEGKQQMLTLTPDNYLGNAISFTQEQAKVIKAWLANCSKAKN